MPAGRTLAIGDIHGCDRALNILLEKLQPAAEDTLVALGDVVDRGPGTRQAIERLLELQQTCRLVLITGNHEEMMFDALMQGDDMVRAWMDLGGWEVLESYDGTLDSIPLEHLEFLQSGVNFFETETDIFVHANLEPGVPLEQQSTDWLRWTRLQGYENPHPSGKRVVCGHSSQKDGLPKVLDGWVCIDTWAYGDGYLSCLNVATDELHQASQQTGEYRMFPLHDVR